jgi:hypothetical protein
MKAISDNLHISDSSFGKILLLVCAVGSLWSDNPGVMYPGSSSWHSAGWKWYNQAQGMSLNQFWIPTLYQAQYWAVSVLNKKLTRI